MLPPPPPPAARNLLDRFRGCLLGAAVGDALGAPFEGAATVDPEDLARWSAGSGPLVWTDDTVMTKVVAESLTARRRVDGPDLALRLLAAYDAEPWRGYGAGPPQVFAALRRGARWDDPATALFDGQGSYGNGGAMRVAPVGLLGYRDPAAAGAQAREAARVTHAHPVGLDGAAVQASAVAVLVSCRPGDDAVGRAVEQALATAETDDLRDRLALVPALADAPAADAVARLGTGVTAAESVPAALYALAAHPDSLRAAVEAAVALGGDTDTIASMTGALAGALHGAGAIPRSWLGRLEGSGTLSDVADRLLATTLAADGGRDG